MATKCEHLSEIQDVDTQRAGMRGMPEDRRSVGTLAPVQNLRPRRMLRLVEEQARDQALSTPPDTPLYSRSRKAKTGCGAMRTKSMWRISLAQADYP